MTTGRGLDMPVDVNVWFALPLVPRFVVIVPPPFRFSPGGQAVYNTCVATGVGPYSRGAAALTPLVVRPPPACRASPCPFLLLCGVWTNAGCTGRHAPGGGIPVAGCSPSLTHSFHPSPHLTVPPAAPFHLPTCVGVWWHASVLSLLLALHHSLLLLAILSYFFNFNGLYYSLYRRSSRGCDRAGDNGPAVWRDIKAWRSWRGATPREAWR